MRIDHHSYQRATRVAGVGFLVQAAIGLTMLVFSLVGSERAPVQDTTALFGSVYILIGLIPWVGLIIIFNQHKLERLEALEEDELASTRGGGQSMFETADDELRVAARRLRLMHRWLMPGASLLIAAGLALSSWLMIRQLGRVADGLADFYLTEHLGWAVSICLAFSALSFIVSRFVAGMAKQAAWQNLRGGAASMVGNSLVTLAIAVGIGFRFFKNDEVVKAIAYAIPIFMLVVAIEIVLNFILNLYRPRIPGEAPRPAFDSKLLSILSAPDYLVRSINEAVNYQFGFDITSSWGYQLLLRSFVWLLVVGLVVLMLLNMMVIVEPHQQAVKLSRGALADGAIHRSGVMWKLPSPLQSREIYDVTSLRELHLTSAQIAELDQPSLWTDDLGRRFDAPLVPFVVESSRLTRGELPATPRASTGGDAEPDHEERISENFSLVDCEIVLAYAIKEDGGLEDYLRFSSDEYSRAFRSTIREQALKSIALREITQHMAQRSIDEVLASRRAELPGILRDRVQAAFDLHRTGIEVVSVSLPLIRPAGEAAAGFEELSVSYQARQEHVANARQLIVAGLAQLVGDAENADEIVAEITEWRRRGDELGLDAPETVAQRLKAAALVRRSGGYAAQLIAQAERDRWVQLMETRAEANRIRGQVLPYRAAPDLYRRRETMLVYGYALANLHKYVLCVDPSRVHFDLDLKELDALFGFGDAFQEEAGVTPR